MKRFLAVSSIVIALAAPPTWADDFSNQRNGQIVGLVIGGGAGNPIDSRPCVFFTLDDGAGWYAVSQDDGNYAAEKDFLIAMTLSGYQVRVFASGMACGFTRVGGLTVARP